MCGVILVSDPDEEELNRVVNLLGVESYQVYGATQNIEHLLHLIELRPDLIVLAEHIPQTDIKRQLALLWQLHREAILVISDGNEREEVEALDGGANFYLRRPFTDNVLLARVKALLRRQKKNAPHARQRIRLPVSVPSFSTIEHRLFVRLLISRGRIVTWNELLGELESRTTNYENLKYHMQQLRGKLALISASLQLVNVRGIGYRLIYEGESPAVFHDSRW